MRKSYFSTFIDKFKIINFAFILVFSLSGCTQSNNYAPISSASPTYISGNQSSSNAIIISRGIDKDIVKATLSGYTIKNVAMLLPLKGQYSGMGKAIRDGYLTALNYDQSPNKPVVRVYDESNVVNTYQQAVQDGAELIIGPLLKADVFTLSQTPLTTQTLSLNYLNGNTSSINNLYQFGLSPEQTTEQAADKARQIGIKNVLLIASYNSWGLQMKDVFATRFQSTGGHIAKIINFTTALDLSNQIKSTVTIETYQTKSRHPKIKGIPKLRENIDGICIIANHDQALQINPWLKYYYVDNLPIISISNIYSGIANPQTDRDLNGIVFNDIPWVFANTGYLGNLKQLIQNKFSDDYNQNVRLYALGVDAYKIGKLIPKSTSSVQNFNMNGATGQLYIKSNNQFYRKLVWAKFIDGTPKVIE